MPPTTLRSGLPTTGTGDDCSKLKVSNFRLPGPVVSCHNAQRASEEGVGSAMESL